MKLPYFIHFHRFTDRFLKGHLLAFLFIKGSDFQVTIHRLGLDAQNSEGIG